MNTFKWIGLVIDYNTLVKKFIYSTQKNFSEIFNFDKIFFLYVFLDNWLYLFCMFLFVMVPLDLLGRLKNATVYRITVHKQSVVSTLKHKNAFYTVKFIAVFCFVVVCDWFRVHLIEVQFAR